MVRFFPNEVFKEFPVEGKRKFRYAISNLGRFVSFTTTVKEGTLLKGATIDGYKVLSFRIQGIEKKKYKLYFAFHLVAEYFVPKTAEDQKYIIHLDHSKDNDVYKNLKWVNYEEKIQHYKKNPKVIAAKKKLLEHNIKADGPKLTETTVMRLKKILLDPNRKTRMKILAKQFGVSEMQLYRIKRGENWGHIKVKIPKKNDSEQS